MIQRLQTVLLFLAAAFTFLLMFTPSWEVMHNDGETGATQQYTLYGTGMADSSHGEMGINMFDESTKFIPFHQNAFNLIYFILILASTGWFIYVIFLYKDRPKQLKFAYIGMGLLMITALTVVLSSMQMDEMAGKPADGSETGRMDDFHSDPKFGLLAYGIALIFAWWATRRIKKDERKVRDADRLR